jgi:ABC-type polysaccharide/polyol phosphate transport system ATPase subunit/ABC-type polysaccharide/polyol phosphate export permease
VTDLLTESFGDGLHRRLRPADPDRQLDQHAVIRVSGVSKTFVLPHQRQTTVPERVAHAFSRPAHGRLEALSDVSFEIRRGEFFGVIGRNGGGKSTLLRCIAGIYVPDAGSISVEGRLASFISLGVGFNPELSTRENALQSAVLFGLRPSEAAARLQEIVAFAELERFSDQKLKHLSSGMAARLAFAVTVHVDADVLLLDEVMAVGDAAFRVKCIDQFDRLLELGKTIVMVSHDTRTIEESCDRALLLDHGHVVEVGSPARVVRRYEEITAIAAQRSVESREPVAERLESPRAPRDFLLPAWVRAFTGGLGRLIAPPLGQASMFGPDLGRFLVLVRMLAVTDFRLKYKHAVLNYAWALARPATLFTVMLFIFGALGRFNRDIPHYPAYLVLGVVLWTFFAQAVAGCVGCLTRRGDLLQKLPFPRLAVPLATVTAVAIDLAVNLVVVFSVMLVTGVDPRLSWLELPLILAVVAMLATGIGLILAALYVRYRDLDQLWAVVSQTLFYLTPIFYVASHLPHTVRRPLILANPLATIFTQARHALIDVHAPTGAQLVGGYPLLAVPMAVVVSLFALGVWVFARESPRVTEHV